MNKFVPILFALGTAFFWGLYGPTIGNAQIKGVAPPDGWSPFKAYVFIGIAYLVIAVIGGAIGMNLKGDTFNYTAKVPGTERTHFEPMQWGFLAGALGAFGAFCLTNAMMISKGNSALVMPIVFGGAVTVTGIFNYLKFKDSATISPMLFVGMLVVALGVIMVAYFTPHHADKPHANSGGPPPAATSPAAETH